MAQVVRRAEAVDGSHALCMGTGVVSAPSARLWAVKEEVLSGEGCFVKSTHNERNTI